MATNNGACNNDTAGTATLIVLNGVSAENIGEHGAAKITIREMITVHDFIATPKTDRIKSRLLQAGENV
jgi:hypothetical protein